MWTRRLLLAMLVAAAAVSLPRHVPGSWSAPFEVSGAVTVGSLR
jgi:hypothetical protein